MSRAIRRVYYAPYSLDSIWHGQGHAGALIKIEFHGGTTGYGDLHPWPELGDPSLQEQLTALRSGQRSPRLEQLIRLIELDAEARARGISLFLGATIPRSHRLIGDLRTTRGADVERWRADGYTHCKVKMGRELIAETRAWLSLVAAAPDVKWRLDFNGRLEGAQTEEWLAALDRATLATVDGIEDPVLPGEAPINRRGVDFFVDRTPDAAWFQGRVIKPEIEDPGDKLQRRRVWFTNNLGHPFGHAVALAMASRYGAEEVCGLQGLDEYPPGPWHEWLRYHGPVTLPPPGTGFGCDQWLAKQPWRSLEP